MNYFLCWGIIESYFAIYNIYAVILEDFLNGGFELGV